MRRVILAACFSVLTGCEEKSSPPTSHYDLELQRQEPNGPLYEDEDLKLEASSAQRCTGTGVLAPRDGHERWAIPLHIEVKGRREVPVGPMLFSVWTGDRAYRPTLAGCKTSFPTRTLKPGEELSSYVTFDVPAASGEMRLTYEPFIIGRKKVEAQVVVPPGP